MVTGPVRISLDQLAEDQRRFARQDDLYRVPVGSIEFGKFQLFEDGAGLAQRRDRIVKHLLLLGFGQ